MRHDPAGAALIIMLRSLKMPGMAQAVQDLHEQGSPAFEAAMPILSQLLKAEMAERAVQSTAYHMKAARFPAYKDLSTFDFAASEVREALGSAGSSGKCGKLWEVREALGSAGSSGSPAPSL
jgi:DNA replication protein DnaC